MISPRAAKAHGDACARGQEGYIDPDTGLFVMSAVYLKKRQWCCGSGCRHCPYPPEEQERAGRPKAPSANPKR